MDTKWFKGIPGEQKEAIMKDIKASSYMFKKFMEIVNDWEKEYLRKERSLETYKDPNWPEIQAHINGYIHCLCDVRNLLRQD